MSSKRKSLQLVWRQQATGIIGNWLAVAGFYQFCHWQHEVWIFYFLLGFSAIMPAAMWSCGQHFGNDVGNWLSIRSQIRFFAILYTLCFLPFTIIATSCFLTEPTLSWGIYFSSLYVIATAEAVVAEQYPLPRIGFYAILLTMLPPVVALGLHPNLENRAIAAIGALYMAVLFSRLRNSHANHQSYVKAQQALADQKEELQLLLDSVPGKVAIFDQSFKYLYLNDKLLKDFNMPLEKLLSRRLGEAGDANAERLIKELSPLFSGDLEHKEFELQISIPKQGVRSHRFFARNLDLRRQRRVLALSIDVEAQRQMERDLESLRQSQIVSAKMSALGEMAGGIAHEINNPLTIIRGKATQLKNFIVRGEDVSNEKWLENLEKIESVCDRIARIVVGLRKFSRDSSQDEKSPFEFESMLQDSLSLCVERFKSRGVSVRLNNLLPTGTRLFGHSTLVSQVIINLLNNAFDACADSPLPQVELKVFVRGSSLIMQVTDSGRGVPKEIEPKLFNPFFTTKEVGVGTGLGLSISHGIAKDHEGELLLNREVSDNCFELRLPIYQESSQGRPKNKKAA